MTPMSALIRTSLKVAVFLLLAFAVDGPANAAEEQLPAKSISFSFEGPFGTFERGQLQRG